MQQDYYDKVKFLRLVFSALIHDMRNPLSGISGFVQLIDQRSDDKTIKEYCKTILDSLRNLQQINNEFIETIDEKCVELDKSPLFLSSVFDELSEKLKETFRYNHTDLSFSVEDGVKISGDKEKLVKAFNNILDNSKEAMSEGGKIAVTATCDDCEVKIEINDTGKGIPDHLQESVFKPFVTHGKEEAIGLGLTYSKNIIKGHDGTMSFVSKEGQGTTFLITFPLVLKEE